MAFKSLLKKFLLFISIFILGGYFLFFTHAGLKTISYFIQKILPGQLQIQAVHGSSMQKISLENISYQNTDFSCSIGSLQLIWNPQALLQDKIHLLDLSIDSVEIKSTPYSKNDKNHPFSMEKYLFWLKYLLIDKINITNIKFFYNRPIYIKRFSFTQNQFLTIDSNYGTIEGKIHLDFNNGIMWNTAFNIQNFQSALISSSYQGLLNLIINAQGHFNRKVQQFSIQIPRAYGEINHLPFKGQINIFNNNSDWIIKKFYLEALHTQIQIQARINKNIFLSWQLNVPQLNLISKWTHGSVNSIGTLRGAITSPKVSAKIKADHLIIHEIEIKAINAIINTLKSNHLLLTFNGTQINYHQLSLPKLNIQSEMDFTPTSINVKSQINFFNNNKIKIISILPIWNKLTDFKQPIFSLAKFNINQINFLMPRNQMTQVKGRLIGSAKLTENLSHPKFEADVQLINGYINLTPFHTKLNHIHLNLGYKSNYPAQIHGHFQMGGGQGSLNGHLLLKDMNYLLALKLQAEQLKILAPDEYNIIFSPDINIHIKPNLIDLNGKIKITDANITARDLSEVTTLPKETVILGSEKPSLRSISNLTFKLGLDIKKMKINYQNLNIALKGAIDIMQMPDKQPIGMGNLVITKGTYKLLGRTLKISRGQILYAGNALINPRLNIKAFQLFERVNFEENPIQLLNSNPMPAIYAGTEKLQVGAWVKGELNQPSLIFFSDPAGLSQMDILSYLTFGAPRSQITNANQLAFLNSALTSTQNTSTLSLTHFTKKIEENLHLSELGIGSFEFYDSTTNTIKQATTINIARKFGKRFSIRYKGGIFSPVSVLNLQYKINKNLAIQTEASSVESGADLLYVIEFD